METPLVVAIIAGAVALVSAAGNIWSSLRNAERASANARAIEELRAAKDRDEAAAERQREISKYSEPLARAAYDLQSRLFNILRQGFITAYFTNGNAREKAYVVDNSCYVVAQYLCWTELIRRDIQFIDLDGSTRTLELSRLLDTIYFFWSTDLHLPPLRIFAGEQRAIGEALIDADECMGYGAFLNAFPVGANALIDVVRDDIRLLATDLASAEERLRQIQNALIDLLDLLDPEHIRFPAGRRRKA